MSAVPAVEPAEAPEQKSWTAGMAPAYIGTFLWAAFFDGLGRGPLATGGLIPTLAGVTAAATLAYLLLYRGPAYWGFAARRPLDDLARSTFGARGSAVVPNLAIAVGQVALFAVGVGLATDYMLGGLVDLGMIEPRVIRPLAWRGATVPSPLFLTTALVWGTVTALVGMGIVRWIAAIMQYFPVFPAAGLALVVASTFAGLPAFRAPGLDPATGLALAADLGARVAFLAAFQWTFGFAALLGLAGADWGAASLTRRDVRDGGFVGIAVAPVVVASLALLAVAGHVGKVQDRAALVAPDPAPVPIPRAAPATRSRLGPLVPPPTASPARAAAPGPALAAAPAPGPGRPEVDARFTFRAAVLGSLDRRLAATILITFGLASLAPACFAAFDFGRRFARVAPGFSRPAWTLAGVAAGWLLVVAGWHERADLVFTLLGALLAPVAGALTADSARRRPADPVAPAALNLAGLLAWVVGVAVGLLPIVGRAAGVAALARVPVPALLAFLAAAVAYRLAAVVGLEPRRPAPAGPTAGSPVSPPSGS